MGDLTIAQDIIDGVADVMEAVGAVRQLRIFSYGALTPGNPGAGGTETSSSVNIDAVIVDYTDQEINGSTILAGDRQAIIHIGNLTALQLAGIKSGSQVLDGTTVHRIISTQLVEVSGLTVLAIVQLRNMSFGSYE